MTQGNVTIELDFPRTYREFVERFSSDSACAAYLEQLRWQTEFCCSACGVLGAPWRQTRGRLVCPACRHQTSVTAGTVFDKTRTPLTTWFKAAWHLTIAKNGLSAKTLERTLGTSYRTAWALLQRYRVAMVHSERERLSGAVEVDETLVGGVKRRGKCGRGSSKAVVVIAVEVEEPRASVACACATSPAYLQSYLEEFTFRFNQRNSGSRGLVFRHLMEQAVVAGPLTEAELTFGYDWSRSQGRRS